MGNSWEDIAQTLGVDRKTIYNRLKAAGIHSTRRTFPIISDEDLDEIITEFNNQHPFRGSTIVQAHRETRGIHLPRARVQDSLRRIDPIGVLVWSVASAVIGGLVAHIYTVLIAGLI